jgi:predicted short-subunit dehydrogenase-like oxidoreductase (DUF2520 family)
MLNVSIIGFGRTGSHLYYALKRSKAVNVRIAHKSHVSKPDLKVLSESNLIFICTDDKNIKSAAKKISSSKIDWRGKTVLHTSGAKSSDELAVLKSKGASTGSFHPVQTFEKKANKYSGKLKKIYIAIEGDKRAVKLGFKIARSIGSKPFEIFKDQKALHHICCVISSNFFVALLHGTETLFKETFGKKIHKIGFKNTNFFDIYKPLVDQTLENMAKLGTIRPLTGPIERNDLETLSLHLDSLKKKAPGLLSVYVIMGIETVKVALKKKSLPQKSALSILKLLNKY